MLCFLHWCYSLTALLSANQNRVIFPYMLLCILFVFLFAPNEYYYNFPSPEHNIQISNFKDDLSEYLKERILCPNFISSRFKRRHFGRLYSFNYKRYSASRITCYPTSTSSFQNTYLLLSSRDICPNPGPAYGTNKCSYSNRTVAKTH